MSATSLHTLPTAAAPRATVLGVSAPALPAWVAGLLGTRAAATSFTCPPTARIPAELHAVSTDAGDHSLISVSIRRAVELDAPALTSAVCAAYQLIQQKLSSLAAPHPIRCWNFIPDIHASMGAIDRYMVFNAGRYEALSSADSSGGIRATFPTATGVGWPGPDLVIHCLASTRPGEPIENPRQVPAYRYSARYGPRPPCFARATAAVLRPGAVPSLLLAGTASVVGEESRHEGDLGRQIAETFTNLDALLRAWNTSPHAAGASGSISSLRIYHVPSRSAQRIVGAVLDRYPAVPQIETVAADICRRELLVEIEGVVEAHDASSPNAAK